jgi:hypothetical protein
MYKIQIESLSDARGGLNAQNLLLCVLSSGIQDTTMRERCPRALAQGPLCKCALAVISPRAPPFHSTRCYFSLWFVLLLICRAEYIYLSVSVGAASEILCMHLCECHLASVRQRVLLKCAAARLLKAKHLALRMHAASLSACSYILLQNTATLYLVIIHTHTLTRSNN